MYAFIWNHLPGSRRVRAALVVLLAASLGVLLWYAVFPAIDEWFGT